MSEQRAIVPVNVETWQVIQSIAPVAQASRMFSVTQEQAAIVMLKGYELGLGVASAFEYIHVIDGKPSISPKGALALIHRSGELAALKIEDGDGFCRVTMRRRNGFEYTSTFTMDDAQRADVVKPKSGWEKYPSNMLRWRAIGYCADVVFPDVIGGLYRPEELGATVDADGEPVQFEVISSTPMPAPAMNGNDPAPTQGAMAEGFPPAQRETTLANILAAGFTAEQIMVANEGRIPATSQECADLLEKLRGAA